MSLAQILTGDCRTILPTLEAGSVQTCVSSPPYWGLRDYGTASWEGGSEECDHVKLDMTIAGMDGSTQNSQRQGRTAPDNILYRQKCPKCGARRIDSQLGLESTPEEYVAKMVAVFREVWRVLRDDGTCWINLGDSYATGAGSVGNCPGGGKQGENWQGKMTSPNRMPIKGLKPKDLCGIPWRLAFALQADGWYLRSDIIWHKPNPMPESVTDRPTKAHEYIFLLTKSERYFYDAMAIRELAACPEGPGNISQQRIPNQRLGENANLVNGLYKVGPKEFRNKRTVWTIATQPYAEAHFATFPEDLIKPCIMAGSRLGDTVLDPFAGSGTTGKVALELGRKAILIELNSQYIEMARERTFVTPGFL